MIEGYKWIFSILQVAFDTYVQHGNLYTDLAGETIPRHDMTIKLSAAPGARRR